MARTSGFVCGALICVGVAFPADALKEVTEMTTQLQNSLIHLENFQKLTELQHDLIGIDNLIAPDRVGNFLCLTSKAFIGFDYLGTTFI